MPGFDDVITVDGPSGSGKTSLLRYLGARYGCLALEVGPIVRTLAWFADRHRVSIPDAVAAVAAERSAGRVAIARPGAADLAASEVEIAGLPMRQRTFSGNLGPAVAAASYDAEAMHWVYELVRSEVRDRRAVLSGRQAAELICPQAGLKLRLDASPPVRARRKSAQLAGAGLRPIWHDDAPLLGGGSPYQERIDTTDMTLDEVARTVVRSVERRLRWRATPVTRTSVHEPVAQLLG